MFLCCGICGASAPPREEPKKEKFVRHNSPRPPRPPKPKPTDDYWGL